jgi:hypothetical protein
MDREEPLILTLISMMLKSFDAAVRIVMAWLIVLCIPLATAAQQADADASQSPPGGQGSQGPMIIEPVHNGFAAAPDFKISRFDRSDARLAGGYAGWVLDDTLLLGGGGYWLTNNSRAHKMAYGGAVIGWLAQGDSPISFGLRGLFGGGQATLAATVTGLPTPIPVSFNGRRDGHDFPGINFTRRPTVGDRQVIFDQEFLIFEPQADLLVRITRSIRLDAGVGYRVIGGAERVENRLRGVTGSIGLQFGATGHSRRSP